MSSKSVDEDLLKRIRSLLQTDVGNDLLDYLRLNYDGDQILDIGNNNLTSFRLGQRDVYRELLFQRDKGLTDENE